jgi:hypothetical protein
MCPENINSGILNESPLDSGVIIIPPDNLKQSLHWYCRREVHTKFNAICQTIHHL